MTDTGKTWTPLSTGQIIVHWDMAHPVEQPYPGPAVPLDDRVDYAFRNGWTATGDLPCRQALRAELPFRQITRPTGPFDRVYAGEDGAQVDFSTFRHRPTLIRHALQTRIRLPSARDARMRLETCGGVHLWVDETLAMRFEPFARNSPQEARFTVPLPSGETTLTVLLEDLHERDTTCAFALRFLDDDPVDILAQNGQPIEDIYPDRVFYMGGAAYLQGTSGPVDITGLAPFARGGVSVDPEASRRFTLGPGAPLFDSDETAPGCLDLRLAQGTATRALGATNLPKGQSLPDDLPRAKAMAADLIAAQGGFDPARACLLAIRNENPESVSRILDESLKTIVERWDCSDFTILPLLRLWRDGRAALTAQNQDALRAAVLGWRYWMTEPGNDVMWFWSENHVLCFHAAQAVAGHLFPDETFINSGRTGSQMADWATRRLHRWFDAIDRDGLCEWNSAAYYPIDLLGLFTIHDMLPDLRDRAARLMDRIFVMAALHTTGGTPAGTQGRCYEKELLAGPCTELGSVMAIALGGEFRPGYDRAAGLFCLSDYAPPARIKDLANPQDVIEALYTQGHGHTGKLTLWKSPEAQLSTVTDLPAGEMGHQMQVLDVQMATHPMARLWLNHPGELKPWGERRPSLLAGSHVMPQVAQYGPVGMAVWDIDRDWTEIGFTQLFAMRDAFEPPIRAGAWMIFTCGGARCAVWCSEPLTGVAGLYHDAIWRAHTLRAGWIVTLALPDEDMTAFKARLSRMAPRFDTGALALHCTGVDGADLTLTMAGLHCNGAPLPFDALHPVPTIRHSRDGISFG